MLVCFRVLWVCIVNAKMHGLLTCCWKEPKKGDTTKLCSPEEPTKNEKKPLIRTQNKTSADENAQKYKEMKSDVANTSIDYIRQDSGLTNRSATNSMISDVVNTDIDYTRQVEDSGVSNLSTKSDVKRDSNISTYSMRSDVINKSMESIDKIDLTETVVSGKHSRKSRNKDDDTSRLCSPAKLMKNEKKSLLRTRNKTSADENVGKYNQIINPIATTSIDYMRQDSDISNKSMTNSKISDVVNNNKDYTRQDSGVSNFSTKRDSNSSTYSTRSDVINKSMESIDKMDLTETVVCGKRSRKSRNDLEPLYEGQIRHSGSVETLSQSRLLYRQDSDITNQSIDSLHKIDSKQRITHKSLENIGDLDNDPAQQRRNTFGSFDNDEEEHVRGKFVRGCQRQNSDITNHSIDSLNKIDSKQRLEKRSRSTSLYSRPNSDITNKSIENLNKIDSK